MDPHAALAAEAEAVLAAAFAKLGHEGPLPPFESPPDPSMGDLGCPCFPMARTLRKAPPAIAVDAAAAADASNCQWIAKVEAVGPYVNIHMDRTRLAAAVLDNPAAFITASPKPGKVLIEHTSANPNGPLHVGRARNPVLGDTMVRLYRAAGHDVAAHYYMDDLGRQVAILAWGHHNLNPKELPPLPDGRDKPDHDLVRYYQVANERRESDPAVAEQIKDLVARLESADEEVLAYVGPAYKQCFEGMRASLNRLGVTFDRIDYESDHVRDGTVEQVIQGLRASPRAAQEDDGANYLDLAAELKGNKSTKFFFTRRDGTSVYATRDVAYHKWKSDHVGSDGRLVDILGEDHRLQSLQVGIALDELGARRPDVMFYAFVSLPEGKMSTRANRVVFLDDLLDEAVDRARAAVGQRRGDELDANQLDGIAEAVGIAAIRFNIARVQPEKQIKFRWEDALDFDGNSAPYLMYARARAASLLRKATEAGIASGSSAPAGAGEERLLATIARLQPEAEAAALEGAPHKFCAYALQVASAFNEYYRDHPVIDCDDNAVQSLRMQCVEAAIAALDACHEALGIPILDTM